MKTLIEMKNVSKTFNTGEEVIKALDNANFIAKEGELIGIIGPSGSGKSTFLTILGGLQTPTEGEVFIEGSTFSNLSDKDKTKTRFKKLGFILQSSNLIPFLTVNEQMALYDKINKVKTDSKWRDDLFDNLDIRKLENKYPSELSGGERQRVAIAKALYHNPLVILADEPTASLDTARAFEVVKLLSSQTKIRNKATIMVTHDERMLIYCDKVYSIIDGILKIDINHKKVQV